MDLGAVFYIENTDMDDFNLEDVRIASPCKASWRKMKGDDRVRNCAKCSLNVYNISEMTREEAAELISKTEGRLCIRLWRRRDGTVITKDCPMGFRTLRYGIAVLSSIILGVILATMQWTNIFSRSELERIESLKDLEAGGFARGNVMRVKTDLPAGHRLRKHDLEFVEISTRMIPPGALYDQTLVSGMILRRELAVDSILTQSDIVGDSSRYFNPESARIELNLSFDELHQVDELAKKKKTSVSKLMREWISKRIKKYE